MGKRDHWEEMCREEGVFHAVRKDYKKPTTSFSLGKTTALQFSPCYQFPLREPLSEAQY